MFATKLSVKRFLNWRIYIAFMLIISVTIIVAAFCPEKNNTAVSDGKEWSVKMAESIMARRPAGYGRWDYVTGTVLRGFEEIWRITGDKKYFDYIQKTVDRVVNEDGTIDRYRVTEYNIDNVQEGSMLLLLYKETGREKYKKAADLLREQLEGHPRISEGGFWHKQIYPWQMWLDGLYMGSPFYAEYSKLFNEPENFDDVVKQFVLIDKHLKDEKTGLYYHAWDESRQMFWADKETGLSQCFWGRGLGWYAMAIVDVMDYLPADHKGRESLIAIIQGLAETIKKYQDDKSGVWWQVLDQSDRKGNYLEGSASTMFVYALAKAVRMNYIDKEYFKTVKKGFKGLLTDLIYKDSIGNLNLLRVCSGAGLGGNYSEKIRDGSYEYYVYIEPIRPNDGKATGPFMMAGAEIEKIMNEK